MAGTAGTIESNFRAIPGIAQPLNILYVLLPVSTMNPESNANFSQSA